MPLFNDLFGGVDEMDGRSTTVLGGGEKGLYVVPCDVGLLLGVVVCTLGWVII